MFHIAVLIDGKTPLGLQYWFYWQDGFLLKSVINIINILLA